LGLTPCGFGHIEEVIIQGDALHGALITAVTPGSPAEQAGLQEGDRILAVDGEEVGLEDNLEQLIGARQPGDRVTLEISSTGEEPRQIQVELGENPDQEGKAYLGVKYFPALSVRHQDGAPFRLLPGERHPLEIPYLPEGVSQAVLVGKVLPGSPAEAAGLQEKDFITEIDGETIDSPESLLKTVQSHQPGDQVTLTVFHPGDTEVKAVEIILGEDPQETGKAYLGISDLGFINIQRKENGSPGTQFDFNFDFPVPDFLDRMREKLLSGETL
jgi:S1-C subfamily serine protease